jgi:hypothetical protein
LKQLPIHLGKLFVAGTRREIFLFLGGRLPIAKNEGGENEHKKENNKEWKDSEFHFNFWINSTNLIE